MAVAYLATALLVQAKMSRASMSTGSDDGGYTSVKRALRLLQAFDRYHSRRAVGELAQATGLHKSIVTRLMATMAQQGFVVQDPSTRRYMIGPMLFSAGSLYEPAAMYREVSEPVLNELAARCGYTCGIGVPIGSEVIMVAVVEPPPSNGIRVSMVIGSRRPIYIGSTGKVIMSGMSDEQVRAILGNGELPSWTAHTPPTVDKLIEELAEIRASGYATNREESVLGSGGVAAPVVDPAGGVVAGLFITFPVQFVPEPEMHVLAELATSAAQRISRHLGGASVSVPQAGG
jgi:DNA-binding IclR family transcriptional regulator